MRRRPVRLLILGTGGMANTHASAFAAMPGVTLAAGVDTRPAQLADFRARHGIGKGFASVEEALDWGRFDAVANVTPDPVHHPTTLPCLAAGKHVLCEKPLAMTVAEAAQMVAAARRAGLVFATNHHLRCSGSHRAIRDLIASGRIGRVLSLRIFHAVHLPPHLQGWRINDAGAGGGVIPDITVHDADVTRFLLGEDPREVVAQMAASGMGEGVEDSCMSVWAMPSGAMVFAHESFTHPFAGSGLEVHGTEGSILARGVMTQKPVGEIELVTAGGRETVPYPAHDLYGFGLQAFAEAVAGRGAPAASGEDGVKSLAVAMAVREAARTGLRVAVAYP